MVIHGRSGQGGGGRSRNVGRIRLVHLLKKKYAKLKEKLMRAKKVEAFLERWKRSNQRDLLAMARQLEILNRKRGWVRLRTRLLRIRQVKGGLRAGVRLLAKQNQMLVRILRKQTRNLRKQQKLSVAIILALLEMSDSLTQRQI